MTVKQLIAFIAVAWTFTFVVWGLTVVSHNTVKNKLVVEINELRERVTVIEKVVKVKVSVSAYTPTIAECDTTPFIMASGKRVYEGAIALSRDIEKDFGLKFGDEVTLFGRTFVFEDRMAKRMKRKADIFMWSKKAARQWGRKQGMLIIKLDNPEITS